MGDDFITNVEGKRIVAEARNWVDTKYVYGGITKSGADCSGSTWAIYAGAGFPYDAKYRPSSQLAHNPKFKLVPNSIPQEGDVAWWPGHVAIYAGDGMIYTAHNTGGPAYSRVSLAMWVKSRKGLQPKWYRYIH